MKLLIKLITLKKGTQGLEHAYIFVDFSLSLYLVKRDEPYDVVQCLPHSTFFVNVKVLQLQKDNLSNTMVKFFD